MDQINYLLKISFAFLKSSQIEDEKLSLLSQEKTFTARIAFCKNNFPRLATGSSRIVYQLPNNLVLKLAKNEKGLLQNRNEDDSFLDKSWLINSPIQSDKNYYWIIVAQAGKISKNIFEQYTKMNWDEFCDLLKSWKDNKIKKITPEMQIYFDNEYMQEIQELVSSANLAVGDLCRLSSWGLIDDKLKIIDAGLTHDIYSEFYSKK